MSSHDDYAPRSSRRERPRYDDAGGLPYPDQQDPRSAPRRPRHDISPLPLAPDPRDELPRRKRDVDPRDLEPPSHTHEKRPPRDYRDMPSDRGPDPIRKSNTAARRRSPYSDDDPDSRHSKRPGAPASYGRSRGYREPVPEPEVFHSDRDSGKGRPSRRPRDYDDHSPDPIRRVKSTREPDRRRRDDPYDEPRSRRARSPDDRYGDRDRGYKSDGRDAYKKRRDDDRSDDRHRPHRRDDGYVSDRGQRRDRDRDRYTDRDRDRHTDRDRDRRRYDSDRDRDRDRHDRDRDHDHDHDKSKKKGFGMGDVNKLYEQGQKHYKSVAPLIEKVAKMYMDSKGGGGR